MFCTYSILWADEGTWICVAVTWSSQLCFGLPSWSYNVAGDVASSCKGFIRDSKRVLAWLLKTYWSAVGVWKGVVYKSVIMPT